MNKLIFILSVLIITPLSSQARDCGLEGDIGKRILDCNHQKKDNSGKIWNLVYVKSKSGMTFLVWQDDVTKYLWSRYFLASQSFSFKICGENSSHFATGNILGNWSIASRSDYKNIYETGAFSFIGDPGFSHWTNINGYMIKVERDVVSENHPDNTLSVVCVMK